MQNIERSIRSQAASLHGFGVRTGGAGNSLLPAHPCRTQYCWPLSVEICRMATAKTFQSDTDS